MLAGQLSCDGTIELGCRNLVCFAQNRLAICRPLRFLAALGFRFGLMVGPLRQLCMASRWVRSIELMHVGLSPRFPGVPSNHG